MKIVGNRTIIALAIKVAVAAAQAKGWIDEAHAAQLQEILTYLAGIFFTLKVQNAVDSGKLRL